MPYPSRHERGYGYAWTKRRKEAIERDKGMCVACAAQGRDTVAREVDHIIPKDQDGSDDLDNLQSLCSPCHKEKTRRENSKTILAVGEDGWPLPG